MKIKQKLLLVSALSCAAVAAVGYLAGSHKKEEEKADLAIETNAENEIHEDNN